MKRVAAEQCFDILTVNHLLHKLEEDYADLKANRTSSRHALNCAMTAWHVKDWLWAQLFKGDKQLQKKRFGGAVTLSEFDARLTRECPDLELVQVVCTGAKHFGTPSDVGLGGLMSIGALMKTVGNRSPRVSRLLPSTFGLWAVGRDGTLRPFVEVVENVIVFWKTFVTPEPYAKPLKEADTEFEKVMTAIRRTKALKAARKRLRAKRNEDAT